MGALRALWAIFGTLLICAQCHSPLSDPFQPGNYSVAQLSLSARTIGVDGLHCEVWAPRELGEYPTVAFASAFGMITPSRVYSKLFERLASHGVVVAGFSKINNPNYPILAAEFGHAVNWMEANLTGTLSSHGLAAVADVQHRLVVAGHSAGNHIVTRMLEDGCGLAKAFIMVDPVDGVDPFGMIKQFVIHPPAKVNFTIPALHIETGNDPVPAFRHAKKYPACAPANMSNNRFYDAWRGPIWQINATRYGHLDVCDNGIFRLVSSPICREEKGVDLTIYRDTVADLMHCFIRGILDGENAH